jgi:hypothetical protein
MIKYKGVISWNIVVFLWSMLIWRVPRYQTPDGGRRRRLTVQLYAEGPSLYPSVHDRGKPQMGSPELLSNTVRPLPPPGP